MLDKEFKFYKDNQEQLVSEYDGKYIVVVGTEVVGVYNTQLEAYFGAKDKYELGSFLIQLCTSGEESYTQVFHSRATFDLVG